MTARSTVSTTEALTRFKLNQRIQHILLIVSFTTLCLTGLPQSFSGTGWGQMVLRLLGGIEQARLIHHLAATMMVFEFLYHVITVLVDLLFAPSWSMLPRFQDVRDAWQMVAYLRGRAPTLPQFDRFDFRQKLEYWALIWGTVLMIVTGLVLMFPVEAARFLPGIVIYAAKAAHGYEAVLAFASIIVWHMYNTHLAPNMFPVDTTIFTGKISSERMMEEHPREYEHWAASHTLATPEAGTTEEAERG
jgi:formate dehydrogenase gamma subunit